MIDFFKPTFPRSEPDQLEAMRQERPTVWQAKTAYFNEQIASGKVRLPFACPFMISLAAVKTDINGMVNLSALDSLARVFARAVWNAGIRTDDNMKRFSN